MTTEPSLAALSRGEGGGEPAAALLPRPPFRWATRVVLPVGMLMVLAAVLLYSARSALRPTVAVHVAPVVPRSSAAVRESDPEPAGEPTVLAQAPGWIEPSPYAISVPALTDGVVAEVLVLEGQHVEAGQVIARLVDADAKLLLRRAEAGRAEAEAAVLNARATAEAAEARLGELRDELERKRTLAGTGAVGAGDLARIELRLIATEREAAAVRSAIVVAEAAVAARVVECDQARLALERTQVVSPVAGVVLTRQIEPGVRLNMTGASSASGPEPGVVRLYDPKHLQVRVEVPLAEAGRIAPGVAAEVTTEAMPDRTFAGEVIGIVHEANIQRNTVQFKVRVLEPDAVLKPEMLCRVKFMGRMPHGGGVGGEGGRSGNAGGVLIAPARALLERQGDRARVWVVDQSGSTPSAAMREVTIGSERGPGEVEVMSGLRAGERLIVDPPGNLKPGARVRVLDEAASAPSPTDQPAR